ncbi:hypothetical protein KQ304_03640 [Synechococcus sp. CS-1329]|uniref:hypothetical protein n=1 Tax=Synechococcus sp. CS-1329 TaxID=2847975 RepID=UPI00223B2B8E|nr:hypothetical protein [Synechococcus sp. CS-1329]MCT0218097.1 hypothetical protein [Synechococcus sp. CS-1329]
MREATTEEEFATLITIITGAASIEQNCIANGAELRSKNAVNPIQSLKIVDLH